MAYSSNMIPRAFTKVSLLLVFWQLAVILLVVLQQTQANPKSRPYVAYRTSPFDQDEFVSRRIMEDGIEQSSSDKGGR